MQVERIEVDRKKALELYRAYKTHQHYQQPLDAAIQRAYQLISQGRIIIKALESIKAAGVNAQGFPMLAICNAQAQRCGVRMNRNGSAEMWRSERELNWSDKTNVFRFPEDTFPRRADYGEKAESMVPLVPIHLRPKRALGAYHILYEAEWSKAVPIDPMLLRRLKGDMWLVVAAWDLTEVERAALATRLTA